MCYLSCLSLQWWGCESYLNLLGVIWNHSWSSLVPALPWLLSGIVKVFSFVDIFVTERWLSYNYSGLVCTPHTTVKLSIKKKSAFLGCSEGSLLTAKVCSYVLESKRMQIHTVMDYLSWSNCCVSYCHIWLLRIIKVE